MQYFNVWAQNGLAHPNYLVEQVINFLKAYSDGKNVITVPKNFTGRKVGAQVGTPAASSITEYKLLANGKESFLESEHMVITHMRILSGIEATPLLTDWIAGIADIGLLNSTWKLVVNGLTLYDEMPMDLFTESVEQNDSGYFSLTSPVAWYGNSKAVFSIVGAAGIVATTNVKVELMGPGFTA